MFGSDPIYNVDIETFGGKKTSNIDVKKKMSLCHTRGRLTVPYRRRKYPEWVEIAESLVRYARKHLVIREAGMYSQTVHSVASEPGGEASRVSHTSVLSTHHLEKWQ